MIRESLVYLKKTSDVRRGYVYVLRHNAAMTSPLINLNIVVRVSTNVYWNRVAANHWKSIVESNEKVNVTSNDRVFRTNNLTVATYEQVKKSLSYFYPKLTVKTDGIHTQPPNL